VGVFVIVVPLTESADRAAPEAAACHRTPLGYLGENESQQREKQ
jgi:hypothetical protein